MNLDYQMPADFFSFIFSPPDLCNKNCTLIFQCSKSCGAGIQSRIVSCVNSRGQPSSSCDRSMEPDFTRPCNNGECLPVPLG